MVNGLGDLIAMGVTIYACAEAAAAVRNVSAYWRARRYARLRRTRGVDTGVSSTAVFDLRPGNAGVWSLTGVDRAQR